ncbi:DJ-1 family glyoxalase III [Psittacicella gerlachiana]|uniref:DJ-1/PfpI domain-containing protein n=1 Tax=Psittacicella gerlachiana TaxID=2028574 RepID=A0A3A1YHY5_9GAMM|nr:DJ-1 family glyoxalase III [Psittacicella gerlachiana]RIY35844.1 hypothetical protein CKF59_03205 [Psittacicella gerlachiana]
MTKKVALLLTKNFETVEALAPVDIMRRAGLEVTTISLDQEQVVTSAQGVAVTADQLLHEVADFTAFDALVLPGGGLDPQKYLDREKEVSFFAQSSDKLLAAICMAPVVVASLGLLNDQTVVCYPTLASNLEGNGAKYQDQKTVYLEEQVILTGQAPGVAYDFGFEIVRVLLGAEKANAVAQEMFFSYKA